MLFKQTLTDKSLFDCMSRKKSPAMNQGEQNGQQHYNRILVKFAVLGKHWINQAHKASFISGTHQQFPRLQTETNNPATTDASCHSYAK